MNKLRYAFLGLCCLGLLSGNVLAQAAAPAMENYARLPLAFEQHGDRFVARGRGYGVAVDGGKLVVGVEAKDRTTRAASLEFAGAQSGRAIPGPELPGK